MNFGYFEEICVNGGARLSISFKTEARSSVYSFVRF